jgi:methionine-rich copper-binding protein CopC
MSVTSAWARRALRILVSLAWLAAAVPVAAHAELEATFPQAGASLDATPEVVAARFSEALVGDSSIELLGPNGERIATGGIDPNDPRRLNLTVPPDAGPGEYTARTRAFAADGHLETDEFTFTVVEPTPAPRTPPPATDEPTSEATPTPRAAPTEVPVPTPSATPGATSASGLDILLPILGVLIALIALGLLLSRRRGPARP